MSVKILGRIPKPVRGLARAAAAFAFVRGALHHVEEKIVSSARRICRLRGVVGFVFQAEPAPAVDLNIAFRWMTPQMKVQSHGEKPSGSPYSAHLLHWPVAEYRLAVNVALAHGAEVPAVIGQTAMVS